MPLPPPPLAPGLSSKIWSELAPGSKGRIARIRQESATRQSLAGPGRNGVYFSGFPGSCESEHPSFGPIVTLPALTSNPVPCSRGPASLIFAGRFEGTLKTEGPVSAGTAKIRDSGRCRLPPHMIARLVSAGESSATIILRPCPPRQGAPVPPTSFRFTAQTQPAVFSTSVPSGAPARVCPPVHKSAARWSRRPRKRRRPSNFGYQWALSGAAQSSAEHQPTKGHSLKECDDDQFVMKSHVHRTFFLYFAVRPPRGAARHN